MFTLSREGADFDSVTVYHWHLISQASVKIGRVSESGDFVTGKHWKETGAAQGVTKILLGFEVGHDDIMKLCTGQ